MSKGVSAFSKTVVQKVLMGQPCRGVDTPCEGCVFSFPFSLSLSISISVCLSLSLSDFLSPYVYVYIYTHTFISATSSACRASGYEFEGLPVGVSRFRASNHRGLMIQTLHHP